MGAISRLLKSVVVNTRLVQLQQRVRQLEAVAEELVPLVERYYRDDPSADNDLSSKGQRWYRGCRELLAKNELSSLREFDDCYRSSSDDDYYNLEPVLSARSRQVQTRQYIWNSSGKRLLEVMAAQCLRPGR